MEQSARYLLHSPEPGNHRRGEHCWCKPQWQDELPDILIGNFLTKEDLGARFLALWNAAEQVRADMECMARLMREGGHSEEAKAWDYKAAKLQVALLTAMPRG